VPHYDRGVNADQVTAEDRDGLDALDARLKTLLPAEYQETYENVQPVPMRGAGLKYDASGAVAWDQIWGSFCDLAMAGGPPHKGTLLEHGSEAEIDARFDRYDEVVDEICRGIKMVTGLRAYASPAPGWVSVTCLSDTMAEWLLRAIVMENVDVRRRGAVLELPAAPHFRLEKEIKNVITVIAKTCHYWMGHMPADQQRAVGSLLRKMGGSPLLQPDRAETAAPDDARRSKVGAAIERQTGLRASKPDYAGWLGLECPDVRSAVWMMRALVASNVLSRREGTRLFVPVDGSVDPDGERVIGATVRVSRYACARGVLTTNHEPRTVR
jgi:sirohydrochlorin cobaltochelatase